MSPKGRVRRSEAGFTLAEVLLAAVIITIAFVALLSVIPYSTSAVQGGNQTSTATFLRSEEHTSELQSRENLVYRLLLEKKKKKKYCVHIITKKKKIKEGNI